MIEGKVRKKRELWPGAAKEERGRSNVSSTKREKKKEKKNVGGRRRGEKGEFLFVDHPEQSGRKSNEYFPMVKGKGGGGKKKEEREEKLGRILLGTGRTAEVCS